MSDKIAVIDFGGYETKVGWAGDKSPVDTFPTIATETREGFSKFRAVGHSADPIHGRIKSVIENGIVTNWDDMEDIIKSAFYDTLKVDPSETPVIISETLMEGYKTAQREKFTQLMFDTFNVPALYVASQSYLSLLATGRETGMSLNIGDCSSIAVPIYESCPCIYALKKSLVSGRQLTDYFCRLIGTAKGYDFSSYLQKKDVYQIKDSKCYVALDYNAELEKAPQMHDKWRSEILKVRDIDIDLQEERFKCPELLFQPELYGIHCDSITNVLFDSLKAAPIEFRDELYSNIVLSGGTTKLDGFKERIEKELSEITPSKFKIEFVAPEDRDLLVWKGGSILASRPQFEQLKITKDEYDDNYARIVNIKCIT